MSDAADLLEPATVPGRWFDDATGSTLQLIADALVELAGFEMARIAVAREDGLLHAAVVSGNDVVRQASRGRTTPIADLEAELEAGDCWGRFTFVPAPRRRTPAAYPGVPPASLAGPRPEAGGHADVPDDEWQPGDLLVARLRDGDGELRATLRIDKPVDNRRPCPERRPVLERFAAQVERAVVSALERARLVDQVRLVEATREVVRQASRSIDLQDVLERTGEAIVTAYNAEGAWLRLYGPEGDSVVVSQAIDHPLRHGVPDSGIARRTAHKLWARQQVGIVHVDGFVNVDEDEDNLAVQQHLRASGTGSAMLVPLGSGQDCLGSLTLTRAGTARWTSAEMSSAFALGSELGQLLLNARAFQHEQEVAAELRAVDAYKNQLISTVTRELRRPLSAIVDDLEALRGQPLSAYAGQALDAMERTTGRMVRLVEDLMLLSRVVDPENPLQPSPVDLTPIVRDVSELSQVAARERDLTLRLRTPAFQPVVALGDAAELDRVVINLVGNAVKYTQDGGTVTVTLRNTDDEGRDMVELIVADDGIGISSEDQERLFTEFFRSTNPAALVRPGTGLGLTIVDRIVRRHGGRVELFSTVGVGTTVRVLLPAGG
jgi:signal transduction histidine kinase